MCRYFLIICIFFAGLHGRAQVTNTFTLMPVPASLQFNSGRVDIDRAFTIAILGHPDPRLYSEASRFVRRLGERTGIFLDRIGFVTPADRDSTATLVITVTRPGELKLGEDESYDLGTTSGRIATGSRNQIIVSATTDLGAIHALETTLQLVTADGTGYYVPGVAIHDEPRFAWRGLLLDVALHFMPVDEIERTLDGMAATKLNVLHLHLCNDQGFRVESIVFPRLQQLASDGKYYTQQEIRHLVSYAAQRGIRIVPEFVVPAHTTAILTAYPEFASVKRDYHLQRYFGVFDPVMDPTNEQLYPFLQKLFTEMAGLFPDEFFHIGGDENTGKDWENTPHIRAFMAGHHLNDYMALQTWFNGRLLPIIRQCHKTMVGWDEILQPGLPREAVIQSWRGSDSFYAAVRQGHRAILSYGYYIDLIQPASFHYLNDPLPDSIPLDESARHRILGGEATMWSELVTPLTVDSRIWPRTAAIAERLWSPASVRDTDDMYRRLDIVSDRLEALGLRHRSYKGPLMRQLAGTDDTHALETLADVLEPLKIYTRNDGDTLYTVFSPFTKIADLATPDQPLPRRFNRQVDSFLAQPASDLAATILSQLRIWKSNDTGFRRLLARSPVLEEAAPLSAHLAAIATAAIAALNDIDSNRKMPPAELQTDLALVNGAREQSGRCELRVVDPLEKLIRRAASDSTVTMIPPYRDTAFPQAYAVQYLPDTNLSATIQYLNVTCDRNGIIKVLSSAGLLTPSGGQLLYPGKLVRDLSYRPQADQPITNLNTGHGALTYSGNLPCPDLTVVKTINGQRWFGSAAGAFRQRPDGKFDYYASRRWLLGDSVADLAPGPGNSILILTTKGLTVLHFDPMTLEEKARFYEQQVRRRHLRYGLNSTVTRMKNGDPNTGTLEDSDNDGLWTSMYLAAEAFRYATTHSPDALANCRESLDAMQRLYTVDGLKGFPARSFERRGYEVNGKAVWRHSADTAWDWKSTTSSDEAIGHMFVFGVIAELVDDPQVKGQAIRLMDGLMQHIVDHDLYLVDWDGKPTTWGRWNPAYVNARPKMVGDRKITSSNIIAMLQTAYHFTGKPVYRDKAIQLLYRYGYLDNLMRPMKEIGTAPPDADSLSRLLSDGWNHSDDEMYFLGYWGLYRYALNDSLRNAYRSAILDHWQAERPEEEGAWDIVTAITGAPDVDMPAAIRYLQRYPLDLIDWKVRNSGRKDLRFLPPNFRGQTITEVLPPDELPVSRHNTNRFELDGGGSGDAEYSAGDIWLFPYWMAHYLKLIN